MAWARFSLTRMFWWNPVQTKLRLCTIDHVGPKTRLISIHASILTSRLSRILAKACFVSSHRHKQFQAIPSNPKQFQACQAMVSVPAGRRQVCFYNAWSSKAGFGDDMHVLTFPWLIVQKHEVNPRVVWCLGNPPTLGYSGMNLRNSFTH